MRLRRDVRDALLMLAWIAVVVFAVNLAAAILYVFLIGGTAPWSGF
jgi:hypothetical protein